MPASITSVVDAPRLVSSLAKPTRPEWAVTRRSRPAASAAAVNRSPVLEVTHIAGLAHLVRLAAADGDEDAVSVAGVGHVRPPQGGDFRPPQPAHEEQPGDHRVETPPRCGDPLRLDAAAGVVELGEVGGQGRVIELLAGEPGVELAEGAGVGAAGIGADRGVDQAARGRGRRADRGVGRGDLGE